MLKRFYKTKILEAGCDEAGRGCLAGPVYAAAVILDPKVKINGLNDSKKLSESKRDELRIEIEKSALAWAVGVVDNVEIDEINILNASFLAMHRAVDGLKQKPAHLIIDGNRFNAYPNIDHSCIINGDAKYLSIAAASILAKTHRDEFMFKMDDELPNYGWKGNKGYPTIAHRKAIEEHGKTKYHRNSFRLLASQKK
ncbi:MAG: ribonuclease HII [Flavobacteriales bacterium]|nr:ribonuclease HII [Flavobacteriales bacterium]